MEKALEYILTEVNSKIDRIQQLNSRPDIQEIIDILIIHDLPEVYRLCENEVLEKGDLV